MPLPEEKRKTRRKLPWRVFLSIPIPTAFENKLMKNVTPIARRVERIETPATADKHKAVIKSISYDGPMLKALVQRRAPRRQISLPVTVEHRIADRRNAIAVKDGILRTVISDSWFPVTTSCLDRPYPAAKRTT